MDGHFAIAILYKSITGKDLWPGAPDIDFTSILGPGEWFGMGLFEGNRPAESSYRLQRVSGNILGC